MHNGLNPSSWVTVDGPPAVRRGCDLDRPPDERCGRRASAGPFGVVNRPAGNGGRPATGATPCAWSAVLGSEPPRAGARIAVQPRHDWRGKPVLPSRPHPGRREVRGAAPRSGNERRTDGSGRSVRFPGGQPPGLRRPAAEVRPAVRSFGVRKGLGGSAGPVRRGKVVRRGATRFVRRHRVARRSDVHAAMRGGLGPPERTHEVDAREGVVLGGGAGRVAEGRRVSHPSGPRVHGSLGAWGKARHGRRGTLHGRVETRGRVSGATGQPVASGSPSDRTQGAVWVGGLQDLEVRRRSARTSRGMRVPWTPWRLRQRRRPGERRCRRPWCPLRAARRRERASGSAGGSGPRRDAEESWRATIGESESTSGPSGLEGRATGTDGRAEEHGAQPGRPTGQPAGVVQ